MIYREMYEDVCEALREVDGDATKGVKYPFRRRTEHILRVFCWARRLIDDGAYGDAIDRRAVLTAALFHDSGYALALDGANHAGNSARFFLNYAVRQEVEGSVFIADLIRNHSRKDLLRVPGTQPELVALMEADLLDETGAMSIAWDCMAEGARSAPGYEVTYRRLAAQYARLAGRGNPMASELARALWDEKMRLYRAFLDGLARDLTVDAPELDDEG